MVCNPPNGGGLDGTFLRCTPRHRHSPLNATIESRTHSQAQRWRSQTSQGECVLAPRTGARLSLIVYDMKRVSDLALHTTASRSVSSYPHVSPHQLIADLGHVLINRQLTWMCRPRPLLGVKRTWRGLVRTSANDPKRTLVPGAVAGRWTPTASLDQNARTS